MNRPSHPNHPDHDPVSLVGSCGPPKGASAIALASILVLLASLVLAPSLGADEPGSTSDALAWIDSELDGNGGFLPAPASTDPDWGLTADAALAHIATGGADSARTQAIATELLAALDSYTTWDDLGAEFAGVRLAGPLAKVLLVAESAGVDTTDVGGVDLRAELAGLLVTSGEQAGRYADRNPHGPDVSNGFGQAYAVLATAAIGSVEPTSVQFLLAQQCPSGGFRLLYEDTVGCGDDADADPDATALAIQALLVLERTEAVGDALARATGQLISIQAADGSFAGAPPADVANANTTGLAAQALRAAGLLEAADRAAAWVAGQLQLGASAVGTPAEPDIGAIAYDPARRVTALSDGIGTGRDQWRRATPQGLLALDAGLFVQPGDTAPVQPVVPSTTTTSSTTSTTSSTTTTSTIPPAGADATPPPEVPASAAPPAPTATVESAGAGDAQLAATGSHPEILATTAVALLMLGTASLWAGARTRVRRDAWHWQP